MSYLGYKHTDETKEKIRKKAIGRKAWNKGLWLSDNPSYDSCHRRANDVYDKIKKCELCGKSKDVEIHHLDKNINNNNRDNLMAVCPKCHAKFHTRDKIICKLCGGKHKARGYCEKHYERFSRWGDPHIVQTRSGKFKISA